jgi:KDO2-lipid IV(A) lauroyltransferase
VIPFLYMMLVWIPQGTVARAVYRRLFFLLARKEVRQLFLNIERIWGLPPHSSFAKVFAKQVVDCQINVFLDAVHPLSDFEIEGLDILQNHVNEVTSERGQVFITAHLGNWEFSGACTARVTPCAFYALGKPVRWLTPWIEYGRKQLGMATLWTHQQAERKMLQVLKEGNFLALVMDQKPKGRKGPVVNFFGYPTEFVAGPATVAIRSQLGVVAAFCLRVAPGRYRVVSRVLTLPGHGETDVQALTQRFALEIETWIRCYPEQWTWTYKRWR